MDYSRTSEIGTQYNKPLQRTRRSPKNCFNMAVMQFEPPILKEDNLSIKH